MSGTWSDSTKIAVTLIVSGFIVFLVATTTLIGQDFGRQFIATITNTQAEVAGSEIEAIATYNDSLPAASVYIALSKNIGVVDNISGTAYGVNVATVEDLTKLFKYKIHTTVIINSTGDMYRIIISP